MRARILKLILSVFLFLSVTFSIAASPVVFAKNTTHAKATETTYEKVYENGEWWIYEYRDGIFVGKYRDA